MARLKSLARPLLALSWLFLLVQVVMLAARSAGDPSSRPSGQVMDWPRVTPVPSLPNADLDALATLNREAAAQVALVGLAPTENRLGAAQHAVSWMSRAIVRLPKAEGYTVRQWKVLDDWRRLLNDYVNRRSDSLARIMIVSQANSALYRELVMHLQTENGEIASVPTRLEHQLEEEE
ncbi:MAG: hypothetical protein ACYTAS_21995 [Planctomycetota bacterium]|jgi:hypothetical protein